MKYRKLRGVFKDIERESGLDRFTILDKGKATWVGHLRDFSLTGFPEDEIKRHMGKYHDRLDLPLEFIR